MLGQNGHNRSQSAMPLVVSVGAAPGLLWTWGQVPTGMVYTGAIVIPLSAASGPLTALAYVGSAPLNATTVGATVTGSNPAATLVGAFTGPGPIGLVQLFEGEYLSVVVLDLDESAVLSAQSGPATWVQAVDLTSSLVDIVFPTPSNVFSGVFDTAGNLLVNIAAGSVVVSGTVTAKQGTTPWATQDAADGTDGAAVPAAVLQVGGATAADNLEALLVNADGSLVVDATQKGNVPVNVAATTGLANPLPTKDAADGTIGSAVPSTAILIGVADTAGNMLDLGVASAGTSTPTAALPTLVGLDTASKARWLAVDTSGPGNAGRAIVAGVDGTGTAQSLPIAVAGGITPTHVLYVGGSDGADGRALLTDTQGRLILGTDTGTAIPDEALFVAGSDGTNVQALTVTAPGAAVPAEVLVVQAGSDGTDTHLIETNKQGIAYTIPSAPNIAAGDHPPNELLCISISGATVNTQILAAAGAGKRYRVFHCQLRASGLGAGTADINGIFAGGALTCVATASFANTATLDGKPSGIACPANTAISLGVSTNVPSWAVEIVYTLETV